MRFGNHLVRCGGLLLALLTFALLPAAAGAAHQGPWVLPAGDLSTAGQNAQPPQVTTASDGTTTAIWTRSNGANDIVQASTRPPGGSFGEPVDLSATFQNAATPQVATAPDGTTTAVWRLDSGSFGVQTSTRPPGGSFGPPVDLSAGQDAFGSPQITTASDGTTTVVWVGDNGIKAVIHASTRPPGGTFGAPVDLSDTAPFDRFDHAPQITTAPDGTTTAIWYRSDETSFGIQTSTRPPGGSFGPPVDVTAGGPIGFDPDPQITTALDGTTTAVWTSSDGAIDTVQASTRPPGGAFGVPVDLSASGLNAVLPQITAGPDGTTTAIWYGPVGGSIIVQASTRPPGGSFGAPVDVSAAGKNAGFPQITTSPDGTTTAVWVVVNGLSSTNVQASTRPPGGSFALPVDISATSPNPGFPQITTGPGGPTTAVWLGSDGTNDIVQSASTGFTLTLTRSGTGSGTITSSPAGIDCGGTCSSDFVQGTGVTLHAAPASGSAFKGWSGAGCSGAGTCEVTIDEAKSVTAAFVRSKATISKLKVIGPGKARKGKKVTYRVKVTNSGKLTATGVRLKVSGRGVRFKTSVGKIAAGKSRTVKIKLKPTKPGKVKATFKVTSSNAGGKTVRKTITVTR